MSAAIAARAGLSPVMVLWRRACLAVRIWDTRWAMREICPLHDDVALLVHRLRNLEDERRALVGA